MTIAAKEIGPEANLCAEINALQPGEVLFLRPGDYRGPCTIRRGGTTSAPIVISAQTLLDPPRIVYHGQTANVLDIKTGHVTIRGLQIGPTHKAVDGIRIYGHEGIVVEDCTFLGVGGIAVVANHGSVRGLTVRRNVIKDSKSTALYFGCHDGLSCTVSDLIIGQNYIHHVEAAEDEIGYGLQVKLNSTAIIRDNIIVDTKGPGIMVYGATDKRKASIVERNFLERSRNSSGIVVGGGPALVRNNVTVSNADAGIALVDYGKRGLLQDIAILHNTVYGNEKDGIHVSQGKGVETTIVNNAVHVLAGRSAFPPAQPGVRQARNIDCSTISCFLDPAGKNFSPVLGSVLISTGEVLEKTFVVADDFLGRRRNFPPAIGAIEPPGGSIVLGLKKCASCG